MDRRKQPSFVQMILVAGVLMLLIFYGGIAFSTRDPIWFWPRFEEQPYEIVVHCYGEDIDLRRGTEDHQNITNLFNEQLSGQKNWDQLTMSEETYEYYFNTDVNIVLEFLYAPSVRIHSTVRFYNEADTLIMPLDGRHALTNAVFGRIRDQSLTGSMHVTSRTELLDYLSDQGLCALKP